MKRYKLTRSPNPETHASGEVIFIKDENGGIYGGCLDCEDCKEQDLYCEDCSMYEYDKDRISN